MTWETLFLALALVFILEGILPFVSPPLWRRTLDLMLSQKDNTIRIMGLLSILLGMILLYLLRFVMGE